MKGALIGLKNKYIGMSAPVKAAFWFTVCSFLQRGVSMITTPVFTRLLSTEEYGLYSTYLSWESVLLIVVTLCLYKAIMNLYIKYEDQERVLSAVCGLEFTLSFIWLVIGVTFREKIGELLGLYKRYVYDYRGLIIITLLLTAGSAFFGVFAVTFITPTAEARAVSAVVVVSLIGIALYASIFHRAKVFYDKKIWFFALGFCIPLMPHYLSEFILQSSDKIMINYLCGSRDVALYSVAYSAGSLITLITSAINSTFAPYQYQKIKSGEYALLAKRANEVLIFVGAMLAGIMIFSREIVLIFGGMKYIESVDVLIPICIGVFFNYTFQLFARVQEYYERKLMVVIPSILCAVLNLILNYIFINLYGYQAAAYTTFFCYAFFCLLHYFFYRKVCRELLDGQKLYDAKGILLISIGEICVGIAIMFLNRILWLKYVVIAGALMLIIIKRKRLKSVVIDMLSKK